MNRRMVSRKVQLLADPRGRRPLGSALLLALSLVWLLGLALATRGCQGCAVARALEAAGLVGGACVTPLGAMVVRALGAASPAGRGPARAAPPIDGDEAPAGAAAICLLGHVSEDIKLPATSERRPGGSR